MPFLLKFSQFKSNLKAFFLNFKSYFKILLNFLLKLYSIDKGYSIFKTKCFKFYGFKILKHNFF